MWISTRRSKVQRSVQALAWCGLQGLGRSRVSGLNSGVDRINVDINSDSTSKDTMISLSKIVSLLTVDTKWAELVTVYSDFPVKGDRMAE